MRSVRSCSAMATYPQSRDRRPFDRYFPELVAPLRAMLPGRCIVDGEIVIALDETRNQLADSERIVVEARALRRLASLPPVPSARSSPRRKSSTTAAPVRGR